ncbi:MAG: recombinase family protein, partial [Planctomycetota bacterium]
PVLQENLDLPEHLPLAVHRPDGIECPLRRQAASRPDAAVEFVEVGFGPTFDQIGMLGENAQGPAPRQVGYARVSTDDQDLSLQIDALTRQGIPTASIFMDKVSGAKTERPGLTKCLATLRSGDIPVVWRLDRLGRSMRHLITLVEDLRSRGVGFRSLNEGAIDTTCASGELIFNIFSAPAQFERRLIQERTKAGLAAARARGRNGGRPKIDVGDAKVVTAKKLHADKSLEIDDICKTLRISRSTFYRYVRL